MTEAEWLVATNPSFVMAQVPTPSPRKLRLLLCARAHDVWHLLTDPRHQHMVLVAEAFADGVASPADLARARAAAWQARDRYENPKRNRKRGRGVGVPERASVTLASETAASTVTTSAVLQDEWWGPLARQARLADYLRDVFPNPFRPPAFDPRWRTSDVVALARYAYDERDFDRLPLLSDALLDAGCDDEQVIHHCQSDRPHIRGCWVIDALLGRE